MYTTFYLEASFWSLLYFIDQTTANLFHTLPCSRCGKKLNWANYPRKPRGIPQCASCFFSYKFCLCCSKCRHRLNPPSVRFFGRRVYVAIFIMMVFYPKIDEPHRNLVNSVTGSFCKLTFRRWTEWWENIIPLSEIWKKISGVLLPNIDNKFLPHFIFNQFVETHGENTMVIEFLLKFLSPMTVPGDYPPSEYPIRWNKKFAQKLYLLKRSLFSYKKPPD